MTKKWYAKKSGDQGLVIDENTGNNIAVSYDSNDARLIAAAPELLEALKELLIETNQHAKGKCAKLLKACNDARTIIEQATS